VLGVCDNGLVTDHDDVLGIVGCLPEERHTFHDAGALIEHDKFAVVAVPRLSDPERRPSAAILLHG
jgi:hypothetical protein